MQCMCTVQPGNFWRWQRVTWPQVCVPAAWHALPRQKTSIARCPVGHKTALRQSLSPRKYVIRVRYGTDHRPLGRCIRLRSYMRLISSTSHKVSQDRARKTVAPPTHDAAEQSVTHRRQHLNSNGCGTHWYLQTVDSDTTWRWQQATTTTTLANL